MRPQITYQEFETVISDFLKGEEYYQRHIGNNLYEVKFGHISVVCTKKFIDEVDEQVLQLARDYK